MLCALRWTRNRERKEDTKQEKKRKENAWAGPLS
jgi:hypothetical protein